MTTLRELERANVLPPADAISIPVRCFAFEMKGRPTEDVPVGLRCISEANNDWARREAAKDALKAHRNHPAEIANERFNASIMRYRLVKGLCDPQDARLDWKFFKGVGQLRVHEIFTAEGVQFLYAELERVEAMHSPARELADIDDIIELVDLAPQAIERMAPGRAVRLRRLLRFCLDEVAEFRE